MKLSPREASGYFTRPDPERTGLLLHGPDAMRIALKRQDVIRALIGPDGEDEMRLSRIPASDLRKDPARLSDAIKAQSFFPGPRVAFVEDAGDGLTKVIAAALEDWRTGDAQVIVTAGQLTARSALRKLFETHPNAYSAAIYADPPGRDEIEAELKKAGLAALEADAMTDLTALARMLDPGDLRQMIEKLSLYMIGEDAPVTSADLAACAPASTEADIDDILHAVAEARQGEIGPILRRLSAQGVQPVGLCINATRHFRTLHAAASDPGGPAAGLSRSRPPVFGPRRDRMARQASAWGLAKLEDALNLLVDTDLKLRSAGQTAPAMAMVERSLIRLAMMAHRR